jgi:hypothetical protein
MESPGVKPAQVLHRVKGEQQSAQLYGEFSVVCPVCISLPAMQVSGQYAIVESIVIYMDNMTDKTFTVQR